MLKSMFKKVGQRAAEKELHQFHAFLRSGTDSEMAMMLAATGLAREFLRNSNSMSRTFPEGVFLGQTSIDGDLSVELSKYILEINGLRRQLMGAGNPAYEVISSGLGVIVQSIRALQHPELFALGRAVWAELQRGSKGFREAALEIKPHADGTELEALWPMPNMLAPEPPAVGTF